MKSYWHHTKLPSPAVWLSPRKRKRTDIKEDDSSAEEDENILDYSTDSFSDNDDGNNVIDNSKLNIEKVFDIHCIQGLLSDFVSNIQWIWVRERR